MRPSAPSPAPPVVRAVVLPPLAAIPKDLELQRAAELERDLVPVPKAAAAAILPPPVAPQLELAEMRPDMPRGPSTDVEPPPPTMFGEELEAPPEVASPAEAPPAALVAPVSGFPEVVPPNPPQPAVVETTASVPAVGPIAQESLASKGTATSVAPKSAPARETAAVTAVSRPTWRLPAIWAATATIPAVIVWLVMRSPTPPEAKPAEPRPTLEYQAQAVSKPQSAQPQAAPEPLASPAASPAEPPAEASASAAAPEEASEADASAASPEPSVPVLAQTDSSDRIDILILSKPTGARVYRLGREIARTPVTIQIGRGERRVFEVGSPRLGTKRVTLDGEKSEIMVTLAGEVTPPTVYRAAPQPSVKYDKLR